MTEPVTTSALGIKAGPVIAGLLGAIMSSRAFANASLLNRVTSSIAAAGSAAYLTPAVVEYLELHSQAQEYAVSYFVGFFIVNFTSGLLVLSSKFAKDPIGATRDLMALVFRWRAGNYKETKEGAKDE